MRLTRTAAALAATLLAPTAAAGVQPAPTASFGSPITLSGSISDGAGGPLLAGQLYHTNGFTVPEGTTLTVQAGAIVKVNTGLITASGDLVVQGTGGSPVVLTSDADDTVAGDSWADGPTVGSPGDWSGIRVLGTGSLDMTGAVVRFAGSGGWASVYSSGGPITLDGCTLASCSGPGFEMNSSFAPVSVQNCAFDDNLGFAVDECPLQLVPGFSNNTASGNVLGDVIRCNSNTISADTAITTANLLNEVVLLTAGLTVDDGATLSFGAGCIAKTANALLWTIDGSLTTTGTALDPVFLTSDDDDSVGGDTLKDSLTIGAPFDWDGVRIDATGVAALDHTVLRNAGAGGWSAIYSSGGTFALDGCTFENNGGPAIEFNNVDVPVTVANCSFVGNEGYPMDECPLTVVPGFSNNTASGNGLGDTIRSQAGTVGVDTTFTTDNLLNDTIYVDGGVSVPAGVAFTLEEGVIVKVDAADLWSVTGELIARGTASEGVVFTIDLDDDFGGDTFNDGPTVGAPGSWDGIRSLPSGSVDLEHTTIRYAGAGGFRAIYGSGGDIRLLGCTLIDGVGPGIDLNSIAASVQVIDCDIVDNTDVAVDEVRLEQVAGFDSNRASGNGLGDYILVSGSSLPSGEDVTIGPRNLINGALVFVSAMTIDAGASLTLQPGTVLKFNSGLFTNSGNLRVLGSGIRPVVITSIEDDEHAGDTNGDGPSSGAPGQWSGFRSPGGSSGTMRHALVRFGGGGGWDNVRLESNGFSIFGVRSEFSSQDGFALTQTPVASNLVAFGNSDSGIRLNAGSVALSHATAVGNANDGIRREAAFLGTVHNSISWGNLDNFDGFGPGEVFSSNGDATLAGANGNIDADPLFVDASPAVGDLRLQLGSPCMDTADFAVGLASVTDIDENSRLVRTRSTGALNADMGAYERVLWRLGLTGSIASGETFDLSATGPDGLAFYVLGFMETNVLLDPHGYLLAGLVPLFSLGGGFTNASVSVPLPENPVLVGVGLGMQALTVDIADVQVFHLTNLARIEVEPPLP